jgi:pilus assembly protein CpaE
MARVLLIDDEPIYYKMIVHALKPHGYEVEFARTGMDGLKTVPLFNPDVIITDVRLPDLSGYDVARRLRRDPRFEGIPLIFLTSQADLSNKLKAFEVGADDYLSKPFQPEELVARVGMLVRRGEVLRTARQKESIKNEALVITVHSLRGGVGTSSMAVNLGMALYRLWEKPTLVLDSVLNAGQVALMLNASPVHTWEDLTDIRVGDIDSSVIESLVTKHSSGLDFIASPAYPIAVDSFTDEIWQLTMDTLRSSYEYIIIDTAHDFSNVTIHMLNMADQLLMMMSPEMASIRSAVCALNIYEKLGFASDKIFPILNNITPYTGIKQTQVEKVLRRPVKYMIPHQPTEFMRSLNFGEPLVITYPDSPVTTIIEDAAYAFSKEGLKNIPPAAPTAVWKRVTSRVTSKK